MRQKKKLGCQRFMYIFFSLYSPIKLYIELTIVDPSSIVLLDSLKRNSQIFFQICPVLMHGI